MSSEHSMAQEVVEQMLTWYGFDAKQEYSVGGGLIDCVACRKEETTPFMGIEIHISGTLDTDLKKLHSASFLSHKVVLTPDRNLINSISESKSDVSWFPLPGKNERSFEDYIRNLPFATHRDKYWFDGMEIVTSIEETNDPVTRFEAFLRENRLDADLAEKIIYQGAVPGGDGLLVINKYKDTNEYTFLKSLGILAGLEIFWYDMEWDGNINLSYDGVAMPDATRTRKMNGEPIAYGKHKDIIKGVVRKYVQRLADALEIELEDFSEIFNEIALIGTMGNFKKPTNYQNGFEFTSAYDYAANQGVIPAEVARIGALAANPIAISRIWEFGNKLLKIGLGIAVSNEVIKVPYRTLAEIYGFRGKLHSKKESVYDYLGWWILINGGVGKRDMKRQSELLAVPWEKVLDCIEITFSKKFTSRYIPDTSGIRQVGNFINPIRGIGGASDISLFRPQEFLSFCSEKLEEAFLSVILS